MYVKKRITGLVVLLAMIVMVTTTSSLDAHAESGTLTQPVKAVEVVLNDNYFNPKDITIPNGKATTLILKNLGMKEHTFTVEKLRIDTEIKPGKQETIIVKPTKSGTYDLICRYHSQEGMVGKVIVK
ncbi:cupredoxin domain-containing protein [Neobacillus sp. Marseille-QA0830]